MKNVKYAVVASVLIAVLACNSRGSASNRSDTAYGAIDSMPVVTTPITDSSAIITTPSTNDNNVIVPDSTKSN